MHARNGFTLVELAIALMVIGLLIGGVLKGQELIENAKITSFIRQIKAYDTAAMIFRNTYGALPGDIKRPNRIPNCTAALCNTGGNGNGKVALDNSLSPRSIEIYNFFPHLTKAGMIQGPEGLAAEPTSTDETDLFQPITALDFYIGSYETYFHNGDITASGVSLNGYSFPSEYAIYDDYPMIPVKTMSQMDMKMDDGKPHSGDFQIYISGDCPSVGYINGSNENEYAADDTSNASCVIIIRAGY